MCISGGVRTVETFKQLIATAGFDLDDRIGKGQPGNPATLLQGIRNGVGGAGGIKGYGEISGIKGRFRGKGIFFMRRDIG